MDGAGGFFPAESASISDVMKICSYLFPPPAPLPRSLFIFPPQPQTGADGGAERWCERVDTGPPRLSEDLDTEALLLSGEVLMVGGGTAGQEPLMLMRTLLGCR